MVSTAHNEEVGGRQLLSQSKVAQKDEATTENIPKVQREGKSALCSAEQDGRITHDQRTQALLHSR